MNTLWLEIFLFILIWCVVLTLLFLFPIWLLFTGVKRKRRLRMAVGMIWLVLSCGLAILGADMFSARHERILDHGTTPDGREYVLFQVCTGEPYSVNLYIRNAYGGWLFYYVDHEVWPWRHGGRLDFSDGKVRVFCGDEPFRTIDIEFYEKWIIKDERYPAAMTAEEVFNSCRDK